MGDHPSPTPSMDATYPPRGSRGADPALQHGRQRRAAYRMLRPLGHGTQATVRLAELAQTGELFACKAYKKPRMKLHPRSAGAPDEASDFDLLIRRKLWIFQHLAWFPRIVRLVEHFQTESSYYFIFEYAQGLTLQHLKDNRGGRLPEGEVRPVVAALLETIATLHEHGVVHRDVKPANMLLRDAAKPAESLCLADFGSAYVAAVPTPAALFTPPPKLDNAEHIPIARSSSDSRVQEMYTLAGTPFFLPPEIVRGEPYSAKVDTYSLGCCVFELLYGRTPFQGAQSLGELYERIAAGHLEFPAHPPVSEAARDFIACLLRSDPDQRLSAKEAMAHPWVRGLCQQAGAGMLAVPLAGNLDAADISLTSLDNSGIQVTMNEAGELVIAHGTGRADSGMFSASLQGKGAREGEAMEL
ncbi:kinase-like domain-containing protein [Hyaloraphidium curvatum]|nr:kinase-like domain-containing protein [Hyaloraphidium curvatum]